MPARAGPPPPPGPGAPRCGPDRGLRAPLRRREHVRSARGSTAMLVHALFQLASTLPTTETPSAARTPAETLAPAPNGALVPAPNGAIVLEPLAPASSDDEARVELVWLDLDGDQRLDLYVRDPAREDRLLENRGAGRFEDVTIARGLAGAANTRAVLAADFDGDGRVDLLRLVRNAPTQLLRNTSAGFVDVAAELGVAQPSADAAARWLDFDADGWLDLEFDGARGKRVLRNVRGERFERVALGLGTTASAATPPPAAASAAPPTPTPVAAGTAPNTTTPTAAMLPAPRCVDGITDQAQPGACLSASSVPELGMLMPLSNDFFVDPSGRVGLGTITPTARLDVAGAARAQSFAGDGSALTGLDAARVATGTLSDARLSPNVVLTLGAQTISGPKTFSGTPSFTNASAPFAVTSTSRVANLNADLLDGLDSSAFLRSMPVPLVLSGSSSVISTHANASTADGAIAVLGETTATSATRSFGVVGRTHTRDGIGVYGEALGTSTGSSFGGFFESDAPSGFGVFAQDTSTTGGYGGWFQVASSTGVAMGSSADSTSGASTNTSNGLYVRNRSSSQNAYAAVFDGKVHVNGTLSKAGGSFKIDHPLDPANKTLSHSFVESPDMLNVYQGNVETDAGGAATIELPAWFEALNRDFRYQLTVIDADDFAQVRVARGVHENRFTIRSDRPHVLVSWQVTGVRQDPWAEKNRIPVEEEKQGPMRGRYLNPEAYGLPPEFGASALSAPPAARLDGPTPR